MQFLSSNQQPKPINKIYRFGSIVTKQSFPYYAYRAYAAGDGNCLLHSYLYLSYPVYRDTRRNVSEKDNMANNLRYQIGDWFGKKNIDQKEFTNFEYYEGSKFIDNLKSIAESIYNNQKIDRSKLDYISQNNFYSSICNDYLGQESLNAIAELGGYNIVLVSGIIDSTGDEAINIVKKFIYRENKEYIFISLVNRSKGISQSHFEPIIFRDGQNNMFYSLPNNIVDSVFPETKSASFSLKFELSKNILSQTPEVLEIFWYLMFQLQIAKVGTSQTRETSFVEEQHGYLKEGLFPQYNTLVSRFIEFSYSSLMKMFEKTLVMFPKNQQVTELLSKQYIQIYKSNGGTQNIDMGLSEIIQKIDFNY